MDQQVPVAVVCRVLGAPRSSVYARRARSGGRGRPGPASSISDAELVRLIRQVLLTSPFAGEGYRKVRARLRREHGVHVSGKRVLRLLRREGLLAPQRVRGRRRPRPHDGTIIPEVPNQRWGTDATMAWTSSDGWVWVFACVDHYTAEAWAHVAKVGDRFAALQPVYDAVLDRWGRLDADVARGLELRHDWGPQYRSAHLSARWPGLDHRQPGVPGRAGDQRLRRALDPHLEGPVPVGSAARHHRRAPPGRRTPREAYQAAQSAPAA
jgi:putative transposase